MSRGGWVCPKGGNPYHITYPMMHAMLANPPRQTDACENTTLPQLPLGGVIKSHVACLIFLQLFFEHGFQFIYF